MVWLSWKASPVTLVTSVPAVVSLVTASPLSFHGALFPKEEGAINDTNDTTDDDDMAIRLHRTNAGKRFVDSQSTGSDRG